MNNCNKIFRDLDTDLIGEARLVFEVGKSTSRPASAPTELPDETAETDLKLSLAEDMAGVVSGQKAAVEATIGENVDWNTNDENKKSDVIGKFLNSAGELWDQILAVAAFFGLRPSAVEEIRDSEVIPKDGVDNEELDSFRPTGDIVEGTVRVDEKNANRAMHAEEALRENPEWRDHIGRSAKTHGFPVATLTAFIELESGFNPDSLPTYKDAKGKTVRAKWMPKSERVKRGLTLVTSAHGLAQAMHYGVPSYVKSRLPAFLKERADRGETSELPSDPLEIMYNPEIAIDFMGWHLNQKIKEANSAVAKLKLPDSYRLDQNSPTEHLYMSYNNGGRGYALLRRYMDNKTDANFASLCSFQKEPRKINGRDTYSWESRAQYAKRVAEVAGSFDSMLSTVAWSQATGTKRITSTV